MVLSYQKEEHLGLGIGQLVEVIHEECHLRGAQGLQLGNSNLGAEGVRVQLAICSGIGLASHPVVDLEAADNDSPEFRVVLLVERDQEIFEGVDDCLEFEVLDNVVLGFPDVLEQNLQDLEDFYSVYDVVPGV